MLSQKTEPSSQRWPKIRSFLTTPPDLRLSLTASSPPVTTCSTRVQLEFAFPLSEEQATSHFNHTFLVTARYMNASTVGIIFEYSIAQIVRAVSIALKSQPGDKMVPNKLPHESHISPWV